MNLEDAELRMRSFAEGDELGGFNDNNAAAAAVMKRYDELSEKNTAQGLRMAQLEQHNINHQLCLMNVSAIVHDLFAPGEKPLTVEEIRLQLMKVLLMLGGSNV